MSDRWGGWWPGAMSKHSEGASPKRLHLVTDPGFVAKTAGFFASYLCVVAGLAAHEGMRYMAVEAFEQIKLQALQAVHSLAWWSLLGLLSSSCCLIQILLNVLSLGCSGINSWLGPLRPAFVAATLVAISATWFVALPLPFQWLPAAGTTLFSLFLTFTPEIYAAYAWRAAKSAKPPQAQQAAQSEAEIELQKGAMGCISCVSKVRSLVSAQPGVCAVDVCFKEGLVTARLTAPPTDKKAPEELLTRLAGANFPATLKALRGVEKSALCSGRDSAAEDARGGWRGTLVWAQCVFGGLAGSSCCVLQLAINVLTSLEVIRGVGCTGFNKVLGPVRGPVRAVSCALCVISWTRALRRGGPKGSLVAATAVFLAMTFLPEVLVLTGGPPLAPPTHDTQVLGLRVGGMGCEACQRHVQGVLDRVPGVIASSVDFRTGTAEVLVARNWGGKEAGGFDLSLVSQKLDQDGFSIALAQEGEEIEEPEPMETCEEMAAKLFAEAEDEGKEAQ